MYMTSKGEKIQLRKYTRENYSSPSPSPSPSKPDTSKWIIAIIVVAILLFLFFVWKFGSKMFMDNNPK